MDSSLFVVPIERDADVFLALPVGRNLVLLVVCNKRHRLHPLDVNGVQTRWYWSLDGKAGDSCDECPPWAKAEARRLVRVL